MDFRDVLDYVPVVLVVVNALLGLITAWIKLQETRSKPEQEDQTNSSEVKASSSNPAKTTWRRTLTSQRLVPWVILVATVSFAAILLLAILPKRQMRHVEILKPLDTVTISQKFYNDRSDYSYTFEVAGRCADCGAEEWVQLFVLPPQRGPYVPQEGVPVVEGEWEATVYIGDRNNPISSGQTLLMQAVVIHENDLLPVEKRVSSPLAAKERGVSKQHRLTVRFVQ